MTTRLLGATGRGEFALTMAALALVLQFSNGGLHASVIYWLGQKPSRRDEVVGLLAWFSVVPVAGVCGLVLLLVWGVPSLLQDVPLRLLKLALLAAPPAMFLLLAGNVFLGLGRTAAFNLLDLAGKLVGLCAVLTLLAGPLSAVFLVYALLHYAVAVAAYLQLVGPVFPPLPSGALLRGMFAYGLRAFLVGLGMFLVLRIDLFLVNGMLGTAAAGQYSVAVQVGEILSLAAASIAVILFPRLTSMAAEHRWRSTMRVVRVTAWILGAVAIVVGVVSRPVFLGWFGPEFVPAVSALWWLLPGLWCLGISTILQQHLAASGMPWFLVGAMASAVVGNVGLNLVLIPAFGIAGAAAASTATYALLLGLIVWYLGRHDPGATEVGCPSGDRAPAEAT
jgi:O-antigen/teichoic acid export membrane protein